MQARWAPQREPRRCQIRAAGTNVANNAFCQFVRNNSWLFRATADPILLDKSSAERRKLLLVDRAGALQPVQFFQLIRNAEAAEPPQVLARCLRLLRVPPGHASALRDQIDQYADVGCKNNQNDPERFAPSRNVGSSKQVAEDEDQQPEQHDKRKYSDQVDQEVRKAEASIEQHDKPPLQPGLFFDAMSLNDSGMPPFRHKKIIFR